MDNKHIKNNYACTQPVLLFSYFIALTLFLLQTWLKFSTLIFSKWSKCLTLNPLTKAFRCVR